MRLEEWQKWLDNQFVEEQLEAEAVSPHGTSEAPGEPICEPMRTLEIATPHVETSAQTQELHLNNEDVTVVSAPSPIAKTAIPLLDSDPELPQIENYFPFLRNASPGTVTPVQTVDEENEQPELSAVVVLVAPVANNEVVELVSACAPIEEKVLIEDEVSPKPADTKLQAAVIAPTVINPTIKTVEPAQTKATQRHPRSPHRVKAAVAGVADREIDLWGLSSRGYQSFLTNSTNDKSSNSPDGAYKSARIDLVCGLIDPTRSLANSAKQFDTLCFKTATVKSGSHLRHQRASDDLRTFKLADVLAFLEAQSTPETRQAR